jgi:hypothetical protein
MLVDSYHVLWLFWEEHCEARAIFLDDLLLEKAHGEVGWTLALCGVVFCVK